MSNRPNIVVFAYNEIGYQCLKYLIEQQEYISAVFTHPDDPQENIWFNSVAQLAAQCDIPTYTPTTLNCPEEIKRLQQLAPDLIFSFYYRYMIPEAILALPHLGAYNMHGSLLPHYRGRVSINWAIIHGETETGATLHHMTAKPDAGDIVDQQAVPIELTDTTQLVFNKVAGAAREILVRQLAALKAGTAPRRPQDLSLGKYFGGRKPEDGHINWQQSAKQIYDFVRALTRPYPGAFTVLNGKKLWIWQAKLTADSTSTGTVGLILAQNGSLEVQTGHGKLALEVIQWENEPDIHLPASQNFAIVGTFS